MTRKTIFDIYNELHANDVPEQKQESNFVVTQQPENVAAEKVIEKPIEEKQVATPQENINTSSLSEERSEENGV